MIVTLSNSEQEHPLEKQPSKWKNSHARKHIPTRFTQVRRCPMRWFLWMNSSVPKRTGSFVERSNCMLSSGLHPFWVCVTAWAPVAVPLLQAGPPRLDAPSQPLVPEGSQASSSVESTEYPGASPVQETNKTHLECATGSHRKSDSVEENLPRTFGDKLGK